MKFFLAVLFATFLFTTSQAQEFSMPPDITKFGADDCAKYKKDILQLVTWLQQTPISKDKDKRHVSDAFLLTWISHCPDVSIEFKPYVDKFSDVNPEFISLYMGVYAKYSMENSDKDELNCNLAAVKGILEHYKADKDISRSDFMEKLLVTDQKGELKEWVIKELKGK